MMFGRSSKNKSTFDSEQSYVYPGTSVLRNNLDIQDTAALEVAERRLTHIRMSELDLDPVVGKFDAEHLSAIHQHIFQDVHPWAGEFRTIDISKGNTVFVQLEQIKPCLDVIHRDIKKKGKLDQLSYDDTVVLLTSTLVNLNKVHPFREGNGRTQRCFVSQLANACGYSLDFSNVTGNDMRDASVASEKKDFRLMRWLISENLSKTDGVSDLRAKEADAVLSVSSADLDDRVK